MNYDSSFWLLYLAVLLKPIIIVCIAIATIYFWRKSNLFNQQNQWPSIASCALFWAGVAGVFSIILIAYETNFNGLAQAFQTGIFYSLRNGLIGIDQLILLALLPLGAILGAAFGGLFDWLGRNNKASASLLQRGLIGIGVGVVVAIALSALLVVSLNSINHIPQQNVWQDGYFDLVFLWGVAVASVAIFGLILGLITPRHLLKKTNDMINNKFYA